MDGIEDRIEDAGDSASLRDFRAAQERVEIAVRGRDQHRNGAAFPRDVERILLQAQQEIGAGPRAAPEFVHFGGVDADPQTDALDGADAVFEMRKPLVRQTAEIDDVGAGSRHPERARNDRIDRQCRSVDDLGEDAHVVSRKIDFSRALAEESRQILQFVGPALEGHPEFARKLGQIRATATGNDDARRLDADAAAGER